MPVPVIPRDSAWELLSSTFRAVSREWLDHVLSEIHPLFAVQWQQPVENFELSNEFIENHLAPECSAALVFLFVGAARRFAAARAAKQSKGPLQSGLLSKSSERRASPRTNAQIVCRVSGH